MSASPEGVVAPTTVAVVGCGTMGIGIAIVAARGGCETILHDADPARCVQARAEIELFLSGSVKRGKLDAQAATDTLDRLQLASSVADLSTANLVIEAVFETIETKAEIYRALHAVCPTQTIFASNTSTLSITRLAAVSGRPENFVGLHFCLPAQLLKLVEVTPGLRTSAETLARASAFCTSAGQIPIQTKDRPGFILNHFVIPLNVRAIRMVEQGSATARDIDIAMKTAMGFPMGPLELVDLVGLDTQERLCDTFYAITHDSALACPPLVRQMVAAGWLGKKSGRGFYDYKSSATFGADR
jgi:3-hydroxybutyryl-CoA dehydrogenase